MPASEGYKRHFTILKNKKVWLTTDIDEQVKISNTLNLLDKLVSSQNNKINVTVSSSGNTANTNVTPDYAQYYSEKSKEWAISNKIVDIKNKITEIFNL